MQTTAEKSSEPNSRAAADNASENQNQAAAVKQSAVYNEMANNSLQVKQLKFYQSIANAASLKTLQLESFDESPLQREIENNSVADSSDNVIQRSPLDWQVNADIARMLTHPHGYFSTWKKIKENIAAYQLIQPIRATLNARRVLLNKMWALILEWEADSDHTVNSQEQRVHDILNDLPILKQLVQDESYEGRNEVEDNFVLDYGMGILPPQGIPAELTAGVAGTDAAKAQRIFQNINNFRFRYTGGGSPAQVAFSSRQGDCGTLVLMFMKVADAVGIHNDRDFISTRLLVAPGPIHGRTTLGNTEGETDWYFQNHHWAISNGVLFDLLFMVSPPLAHIAYTGGRAHNGVNYHLFADGRVVIEPLQAQLAYQIQGKGRVFATELDAQNFIDGNHV
ncbi:MAG: hypothetical protein ABIQ40_18565 [Bacteroidia bacterium]